MDEHPLDHVPSVTTHRGVIIILEICAALLVIVGALYFYIEYTGILAIINSSIGDVLKVPSSTIPTSKEVLSGRTVSCPTVHMKQSSSSRTPVLVYTKQLYETQSDAGRVFPTYEILQKIGTELPTHIAEVGKVDEYPNRFIMSPDKTMLAINLEHKVEIVDMETQQIYTIFSSDENITTIGFAQDGTRMFIVIEKTSAEWNSKFEFHILTFADCTDTIVYHGENSEGIFFEAVWRDDDHIILNKGYGEGQSSYIYTMSRHELVPAMNNFMFTNISADGKRAAALKDWTPDICNDFSGSVPGSYSIVEPVSGSVRGVVESPGNQVQIRLFSPGNTSVLFSVEKPWEYREDCGKDAVVTYYTQNLQTGKIVKVTDIAQFLKSWGVDYRRLGYIVHDGTGMSAIFVNEKPVVTSTSSLQIIDQFYQ